MSAVPRTGSGDQPGAGINRTDNEMQDRYTYDGWLVAYLQVASSETRS